MTTNDLFISTTCNSNNKNSTYFLPIICSLLILTPYLFKFISFFISPLFFFVSSLVLICIIATSLYHQKTIVDKICPKLVEEQEDDEEGFRDFEESEVYKIVFSDPTLVNGVEQQASVMENSEKKMERLFEELDRFEDSTVMPEETLVSRQNNMQTRDVEACSGEAANLDSPRIFRRLESIKSDLEKASAMAATTTNVLKGGFLIDPVEQPGSGSSGLNGSFGQKRLSFTRSVYDSTGQVNPGFKTPKATTNSADDLQTNENKNSLVTVKSIVSRLESSKTFGSYRLAKLDLEEASSTPISTSGDSSSPSFGSYDSPKSDPEEIEDTKTVENSAKSASSSVRVELGSCNSSFGSYGSMRKEKEWKRTLACKLFEERRSLEGGGEGMDSLWEAYEDDNTNKYSRSSKKKTDVKNNKAKTLKSEFKYFDDGVSEDGDEDDEFMGNGQLCCLKALKMSTGKMNLGMGKPNLVKISKALKGFGWLHHRHAKKC